MFFTLNGQRRAVRVLDKSLGIAVEQKRLADANNPGEIGSPMPGTVLTLHVQSGDAINEGDEIVTMEAMKMETIVRATTTGTIGEIMVREKQALDQGELIATIVQE